MVKFKYRLPCKILQLRHQIVGVSLIRQILVNVPKVHIKFDNNRSGRFEHYLCNKKRYRRQMTGNFSRISGTNCVLCLK